MNSKTSISIIIAFYKNLAFLKCILIALNKQSYSNFEVIIAEDNNAQETKDFIEHQNVLYAFKQVSQEDLGFRKCTILNKAVQAADASYYVFIDGDCIPHKHFVKSYVKLTHLDCCFGRRVMLSDKTSKKVLDSKFKLTMFNLLFSGANALKHAIHIPFFPLIKSKNKGIWGCNWGIQARCFKKVNGFDEDYQLAGIGEDVDIQWRLEKAKVKIYYAKHRPIVFHLHHQAHYDVNTVSKGKAMLSDKKSTGHFFCKNGLIKNKN